MNWTIRIFLIFGPLSSTVTRHYRAPEILLRIGYKEASDVWSVGCIFAEMISNTVLFPGTSSLDQIRIIFQTIGTPRESFVERQSQDFKDWFEMQPKFQGKSFTELFPSKRSVLEWSCSSSSENLSPFLYISYHFFISNSHLNSLVFRPNSALPIG